MELSSLDLIAAERRRQIAMGHTSKHDQQHDKEELAYAAALYAMPKGEVEPMLPAGLFPSEGQEPLGRMEQLAIAGALIVAEMDRLSLSPQLEYVCRDDSTKHIHRAYKYNNIDGLRRHLSVLHGCEAVDIPTSDLDVLAEHHDFHHNYRAGHTHAD